MTDWDALIARYVAPYEPETPGGLGTKNILHPYTPTFVANGYIGITGDWLGIGAGDCQIADVYARSSDPTDTVRARLPRFTAFDLHNGLHWLGGLDRNTTLVLGYRQELDSAGGALLTRFRWHDGDLNIDVATTLFACRHDPHLAVQRVEFTPHFDGELMLEVGIDARRGDLPIDRTSDGSIEQGKVVWCSALTPQRDGEIAIACAIALDGADEVDNWPWAEAGRSISLRAHAGQTVRLTRYVAVVAGKLPEGEGRSDAVNSAHDRACAACTQGYEGVLAAHRAAWAALWEGAITIEGDPFAQAVTRSAQYALLSSLREGSGWSISPQGLSSRGYGGHIFWDADTWIFPGVLLTHPAEAQGIVEYRCDRIAGAQAKAQQYGYAGAMFPWEGDDLGVETTPDWAPCGRYEQHITACVALAQWQWWQASGNLAWLKERGWPVLRECARFWASRVDPAPDTAQPDQQFHIRDVQPADEYALHVDDSAWTNAAAARTLQLAAQAAGLIGEKAPPEWLHVAERLHIPFDAERGIVLEYAGYADQTIKQADVVLLTFPLEWPLDPQVEANSIRFYDSKIDAAHGPAMTYAIHAILAAQVGNQAQLTDYLRRSYAANMRPPFLSFSETPDNDYCTFMTGAGGLLQALLYGVCGARLSDDGLTFPFPALLPEGWTKLAVRMRCRGKAYDVTVTPAGRAVNER